MKVVLHLRINRQNTDAGYPSRTMRERESYFNVKLKIYVLWFFNHIVCFGMGCSVLETSHFSPIYYTYSAQSAWKYN